MHKFRSIAFSLIILLLVPMALVPAQVKAASSVSSFAHLAGTSAPVLSALTSCAIGEITGKVESAAEAAAAKATAPVSANTITNVTNMAKQIQTYVDARSQAHKDLCVTPIERAAAQVILNTLTTETVNWINGGMNGSPMYIQNVSKSLQDLQDNAIGGLISSYNVGSCKSMNENTHIGDQCLYPFAKDILKDTMTELHSSFEMQEKSNLAKIIASGSPGKTPFDFGLNLNNGGWGAFAASFQPVNNPIGFKYKTDQRISNVLQGTNYSPAQALKDQLNWGNGFLSQTKCTDPSFDPTLATTTLDTKTGLASDHNKVIANVCPPSATKITTPGSIVSSKLSKALGNQEDALNLGSNLDASIASIFNALMSTLLQKGLSALSDSTGWSNTGNLTLTSSTNAPTVTGNATVGSLCGVNSSDDWWKQYPKFKFTSDGISEIVSREQILEDVLKNQNAVIDKITEATYALDYCVPGPHPFEPSQASAVAVGNILQNMPTTMDGESDAQFLNNMLGIKAFPNNKVKDLNNLQRTIQGVVSRYLNAVNYEYHDRGPDQYNPRVVVDDLISASDDTKYYSKLGYYAQLKADNEAKLNLMIGTVGQLNSIKNTLSVLESEYGSSNGSLLADKNYKQLFDSFNTLVPDLDVSPYGSQSKTFTSPQLNSSVLNGTGH